MSTPGEVVGQKGESQKPDPVADEAAILARAQRVIEKMQQRSIADQSVDQAVLPAPDPTPEVALPSVDPEAHVEINPADVEVVKAALGADSLSSVPDTKEPTPVVLPDVAASENTPARISGQEDPAHIDLTADIAAAKQMIDERAPVLEPLADTVEEKRAVSSAISSTVDSLPPPTPPISDEERQKIIEAATQLTATGAIEPGPVGEEAPDPFDDFRQELGTEILTRADLERREKKLVGFFDSQRQGQLLRKRDVDAALREVNRLKQLLEQGRTLKDYVQPMINIATGTQKADSPWQRAGFHDRQSAEGALQSQTARYERLMDQYQRGENGLALIRDALATARGELKRFRSVPGRLTIDRNPDAKTTIPEIITAPVESVPFDLQEVVTNPEFMDTFLVAFDGDINSLDIETSNGKERLTKAYEAFVLKNQTTEKLSELFTQQIKNDLDVSLQSSEVTTAVESYLSQLAASKEPGDYESLIELRGQLAAHEQLTQRMQENEQKLAAIGGIDTLKAAAATMERTRASLLVMQKDLNAQYEEISARRTAFQAAARLQAAPLELTLGKRTFDVKNILNPKLWRGPVGFLFRNKKENEAAALLKQKYGLKLRDAISQCNPIDGKYREVVAAFDGVTTDLVNNFIEFEKINAQVDSIEKAGAAKQMMEKILGQMRGQLIQSIPVYRDVAATAMVAVNEQITKILDGDDLSPEKLARADGLIAKLQQKGVSGIPGYLEAFSTDSEAYLSSYADLVHNKIGDQLQIALEKFSGRADQLDQFVKLAGSFGERGKTVAIEAITESLKDVKTPQLKIALQALRIKIKSIAV